MYSDVIFFKQFHTCILSVISDGLVEFAAVKQLYICIVLHCNTFKLILLDGSKVIR